MLIQYLKVWNEVEALKTHVAMVRAELDRAKYLRSVSNRQMCKYGLRKTWEDGVTSIRDLCFELNEVEGKLLEVKRTLFVTRKKLHFSKLPYVRETKDITNEEIATIIAIAKRIAYKALGTAISRVTDESAYNRLKAIQDSIISGDDSGDGVDLIQEAFSALFDVVRKLPTYTGISCLKPFEYLAYNAVNDKIKGNRRGVHFIPTPTDEDGNEDLTVYGIDDGKDFDAIADSDTVEKIVSGAFDKLPERKKRMLYQVTYLCLVYGMTHARTAETLNISRVAVTKYVSQCKRYILKYLRKTKEEKKA